MTLSVSFEEGYSHKAFVEDILKRYDSGERNFEIESSGSTGTVKKVMLSERMLKWSCNQTKFALHLENEKVMCSLPVNKTGGFMQIMRSLYFNWDIHFVEPKSNPLISIPANHPFTLTSLSPLQLYKALETERDKLSRFKTILVGGAKVSEELIKMIDEFSEDHHEIAIVETYGMTETASHIALKFLNKKEKYFNPQMGVIVSLDADQKIIITIPELQHEVRTEDIGSLSFFGFNVLGRADRMINSGGLKIHPAIIEDEIGPVLKSAGINRAFYVTGAADPALSEAITLVLEGTPIKDLTFLQELLVRELPKFHVPQSIRFEETFERTDTDKIIPVRY